MAASCAALGVLVTLGLARAAAPESASGAGTSSLTLAQRIDRLAADEGHRSVTSTYLARAKIALERAARERASGNATNAAMAESGADTWLDAAEALVQAVDGEEQAATLELGSLDAGARADRERALLEEALANAGRRRAELARIERDRGSNMPRLRTADIDGGAAPATSAGARGSDGGVSRDRSRGSETGRDGTRDGGGLELRLPTTAGSRSGAGASSSTPHEESPP